MSGWNGTGHDVVDRGLERGGQTSGVDAHGEEGDERKNDKDNDLFHRGKKSLRSNDNTITTKTTETKQEIGR